MSNPIVKLINFTPRPIETMLYVYKNMHGAVPEGLADIITDSDVTDELKEDFVGYLAAEPLAGGVTEFVSTVWCLKNVSRAFQQQLMRHRQASYSIQSLRIVPKEHFATDDDYHTPSNVKYEETYHRAMRGIEESYSEMVSLGENTEVARGILPLNVCSPITMSINLRSLVGLISARLCRMAQGEFRVVAELMVKEIKLKMAPELWLLFHAPCELSGLCPHADGCGYKPRAAYCEGANTERMKNWVKR